MYVPGKEHDHAFWLVRRSTHQCIINIGRDSSLSIGCHPQNVIRYSDNRAQGVLHAPSYVSGHTDVHDPLNKIVRSAALFGHEARDSLLVSTGHPSLRFREHNIYPT